MNKPILSPKHLVIANPGKSISFCQTLKGPTGSPVMTYFSNKSMKKYDKKN